MIQLEDNHVSYETWECIGDVDSEDIDNVIQELRKIAPYIEWRVRWDEHEILNGQSTIRYPSLLAPLDQEKEAIDVFNQWSEGEEVIEKPIFYTHVFYEERGNKYLEKSVEDFINCIQKTTDLVMYRINLYTYDSLKMLSKALTEIYYQAHNLPVGESPIWSVEPNDCFNVNIDSQNQEKMIQLKAILVDILTMLNVYKEYIVHENSPRVWAAIVEYWNSWFTSEIGWGRAILESLIIIQELLEEIDE